jgi:tetratricopeptide (TPR) repeat protein
MFFLLSTAPADKGKKKEADKPQPPPSRFRTLITWALITIWAFLMAIGVVSIFDPDWLEELAEAGKTWEAQVCKTYGDNQLRNGEYRMAIAQYRTALEIRPDFAGALVNMAIAYNKAGRGEHAISLLEEALKTETRRPGLISYNLGEMYEEIGDTVKAIYYYNRALDTSMNQDQVNLRLGQIYLSRGLYQESREAFVKALEVMTDIGYSYKNMLLRSIAHYETDTVHLTVIEQQLSADIDEEFLKEYDLITIKRTQQDDPEIAKVHNHIGLIDARTGHFESAIEHFRQSLDIWPDNIDAVQNLNRIYQVLNQRRSGRRPQ